MEVHVHDWFSFHHATNEAGPTADFARTIDTSASIVMTVVTVALTFDPKSAPVD